MRLRCVAILAISAGVLLPACASTNRPEGAVEAWLNSLNQGSAGRPERYAPDELSQHVLPDWATREPGDLDLIEVGKGRFEPRAYGGRPDIYAVPYRVKDTEGTTRTGIAGLHRAQGGWRVVLLASPSADPALEVPSEGGERFATASPSLWLLGWGSPPRSSWSAPG
jgi:hypothetical protein